MIFHPHENLTMGSRTSRELRARKEKVSLQQKCSLQESHPQSPNSKRLVLPVTPWNISSWHGSRTVPVIRLRNNSFVTLGIGPPPQVCHVPNMSRFSWNPPPVSRVTSLTDAPLDTKHVSVLTPFSLNNRCFWLRILQYFVSTTNRLRTLYFSQVLVRAQLFRRFGRK